MNSQHLDIVDKCTECHLRSSHFFCELASETVRTIDSITTSNLYPKGAAVFVEGQSPRGVYILCQGRMKLTISSSDGKKLILGTVDSGEVLGLSATISNRPYGVTAEALEPCQSNFVRREDFLRFLDLHTDGYVNVAKHLSRHYRNAHEKILSLGFSRSVVAKLAKLLLDWGAAGVVKTTQGVCFNRILTHDEIASTIGTTRETVSRTFKQLASKKIIEVKGTTLTICDKVALEGIAGA